MSEALEARNDGNLELARQRLTELLESTPNDPSLRRLLENVERNLQQEREAAAAEAAAAEEAAVAAEETVVAEEARPSDPVEPAEPSELDLFLNQMSESDSRHLSLLVEDVQAYRGLAKVQLRNGEYARAVETYEIARAELPLTFATEDLHRQLLEEQANAYLRYAQHQLRENDLIGAEESLAAYAAIAPGSAESRLADRLERELQSPARLPIEEASPGYLEDQAEIKQLIRIGRAQFLNGDLGGAEATFRKVEAIDPYNSEAKALLARIADLKRSSGQLNRLKTRKQMLEEISTAWQRPQVYVDPPEVTLETPELLPIEKRLREIILPRVSFSGQELSRVITTLSAISRQYDPTGEGVNLVPVVGQQEEPLVYIDVTGLPLQDVLDLIVDSVEFQYDIQPNVVIVRPGIRHRSDLARENFSVSPATIQRMMGRSAPPESAAAVNDPFAPTTTPGPEAATATAGESAALKNFLQQAAGIDFTVPGSNLIYDGTDVWITHTPRDIERVRNVFRRLTAVPQVEIEAKFLEVAQSSVDELGFDWNVVSPGGHVRYQTENRTLGQAFAGAQGSSAITVGDLTFPQTPPAIPGAPPMGSGAEPVATIDGAINGYGVDATIRLLSQRTGSDLLSAPKVTVLSGHQAEIAVAQEIRYPEQYGDVQSDVGRGGGGEGSDAGVTITPGTPQDFQTRNVGVELTVTPTVEQDSSITLDLYPRVTEFQGFVEYGGVGLAISGGQVVTIPSGFYQPVFATREIQTTVSVWDGATIVMGGLTREDVRRVDDKLPFFGDLPVVGRLFRSEGEGVQKTNLLIFVTANLVSPGGSPIRQEIRDVEAGALFQNPTIVMPSGAVAREKTQE